MGSLAGKLVVDTDTFATSVSTITKDYRGGTLEQPEYDVAIPDPENEADIHLSARNDHGQAPSPEQVQRCLNSTQFYLIKVRYYRCVLHNMRTCQLHSYFACT